MNFLSFIYNLVQSRLASVQPTYLRLNPQDFQHSLVVPDPQEAGLVVVITLHCWFSIIKKEYKKNCVKRQSPWLFYHKDFQRTCIEI